MSSILCVVRGAGERTQDKACELARSLFGGKSVVLIEERPFFNAVVKTFEIGTAHPDRPLLLALDADVLLSDHAGALLEREWEKYQNIHPTLFRLDFLVRDKFRGRVYAGCHLYNNKYSAEVVPFLKRRGSTPSQRRPESNNVKAFAAESDLKSKDGKEIVGLHDHEQYYRHIYAKYVNRALRDKESFTKIYTMIAEKQKLYSQDRDFAIALAAMEAVSKGDFQQVNTNADLYPPIDFLLDRLGIAEKGSLNV